MTIQEVEINKCKEVFENTNKIKLSQNDLIRLRGIVGNVTELYIYILENYSNVFLKDRYEVHSKYKSALADDKGTEPFMYFLGTGEKDSIFTAYSMYKEQLPNAYIPIALADGGNLICINKEQEGIIYGYMMIAMTFHVKYLIH